MTDCALGTWETCRISSDQAGLGLVFLAIAILVAVVVLRCYRSASLSISSDRDFCADWSEDGKQ